MFGITKPTTKLVGLLTCSAVSKLAVTVIFVVSIALGPRRPTAFYLVVGVLLFIVWPRVCRAKMPISFALKRLAVVEPFIVGVAILALFRPDAKPLFFVVLLKSNMCVFAVLLLGYTTPFNELLGVLRRLHLPAPLLTTLALMYRYLPVLIDESVRMQRARTSRTFARRRMAAWHNAAGVAGQLFVRAADRAERIYLAMCARGWK